MCHIILIMPILGIAIFWILPMSIALPIYLIILTLSILIYNSLLHAMHTPVTTGIQGLIGHKATVLDSINPEGHVKIHGEIWNAVSSNVLRRGEKVDIVGVEGLTLRVQNEGLKTSSGKHC